MMGPGIALQVLPPVSCGDDGRLRIGAPIRGKLIALKKHGFVVRSREGFGVLVHLGLETQGTNETFFETLLEKGALVEQGDPIIAWDVAGSSAEGFDPLLLLTIMEGALTGAPAPGTIVAAGTALGDASRA